jgi:PAP2 superfamily
VVGITRIYVGAHYPRDVLAGAILGSAWGLLGGSSTGMYREAGAAEAIQGEEELRGSRYTKHPTLKAMGLPFGAALLLRKNWRLR